MSSEEIGEICEVIAVVYETRDELYFVLENKHRRVVVVGGDTSYEGWVEDQLDISRLRLRAAVAPLTSFANISDEPGQHGQSCPPVQGRPADVTQGEALVRTRGVVLLLIHTALHVDFLSESFLTAADTFFNYVNLPFLFVSESDSFEAKVEKLHAPATKTRVSPRNELSKILLPLGWTFILQKL